MAGIDVGDGGAKRSTNSDINMIPFIDLLMVTIAFLLITAVWVTNSRVTARANEGANEGPVKPTNVEKVLNVHVGEKEFGLVWKHGATVVSEAKVPRAASVGEGGAASREAVRYPELARKIESEWAAQGGHRDPSDSALDQAVLHTSNATTFKEIVAVIDAIYAPKREMKSSDGHTTKVAAFNMAFSAR
jgi:hypothetical protein